MKLQHRANRYILSSSLIWGLMMALVVELSRKEISQDEVFGIIWKVGSIFIQMLYPLLLSALLYKRTRLWRNAIAFSMVGNLMSTLGVFCLFDVLQNLSWINLIVGMMGIWVMIKISVPTLEQLPALQQEWRSPFWDKLNGSAFLEFLTLRFSSIDEI